MMLAGYRTSSVRVTNLTRESIVLCEEGASHGVAT